MKPNFLFSYYNGEDREKRDKIMNDTEIIELYFIRDEQAIEQTQTKYGARLHGISYNIVGVYEDAEECVNDTYTAAWNSIPPQRPTYFFAYLAKIVRNYSCSRLDYITAKKRHDGMSAVYDELENCIGSCSLDSQMDSHAIIQTVNAFLDGLDSEKRAVFIKRYFFADSISDIASDMGVSQGKIKSMLHRLRRHLKTMLDREGIEI